MFELVIVGTGNVAYHLSKNLSDRKIGFSVFGRNRHELENFQKSFHCNLFHTYEEIPDQAMVLLCVPDQVITEILLQIPPSCKVACTAGMVDLQLLPQRKYTGVFYPLQTFSKLKKLDFSNVPILIEATEKEFLSELAELASLLSEKVHFVNAEKRKQIHLSAVICNNFTNHLHLLARQFLDQQEIDFSILFPLLEETVNKIIEIGPENAQTGPAKRNDRNTIESHLKLIDDNSNLKEIYQQITNSILESHGYKKL